MDLAEMPGRLEGLLRANGEPEDVRVTDVTPIVGGYSLVMASFTATSSSGGSRTLVLRADPPADAALTHTDRTREWELLSSLTARGDVPMPAARMADLTGEHLGRPGIVLDFVDGTQLGTHLSSADPASYPDLSAALAESIATVHAVGEAAVPASFERPDSWNAYVDELIARWRAIEAAHAERDPFIRWVAGWLDANRPPPAPLTLVHGEFQAGNVMLNATGGLDIVDWEFAHVGDPRADLGWFQQVAAFSPPDLIGADPVAFCERYCKASGLSPEVVNPLTIGYFSILGAADAIGSLLQGIAAMANGENHLITSAYLTSAVAFTHRLWREGVLGLEAAMAAVNAHMEGAR
jgi:aminoglycoside phosphotransferase (APT) family kinase protein